MISLISCCSFNRRALARKSRIVKPGESSTQIGAFASSPTTLRQLLIFLRPEHPLAHLVRIDLRAAAQHALRELLLAHFQGEHRARDLRVSATFSMMFIANAVLCVTM